MYHQNTGTFGDRDGKTTVNDHTIFFEIVDLHRFIFTLGSALSLTLELRYIKKTTNCRTDSLRIDPPKRLRLRVFFRFFMEISNFAFCNNYIQTRH